jgi:hypothetical protein
MPSARDLDMVVKRFDVSVPPVDVLIGTLMGGLPHILQAYNCNARERFEDEIRDLTAAVLIFAAIEKGREENVTSSETTSHS